MNSAQRRRLAGQRKRVFHKGSEGGSTVAASFASTGTEPKINRLRGDSLCQNPANTPLENEVSGAVQ